MCEMCKRDTRSEAMIINDADDERRWCSPVVLLSSRVAVARVFEITARVSARLTGFVSEVLPNGAVARR